MTALSQLSAESSVTVARSTPLMDVVDAMTNANAYTALVVEQGRPVGIVTHKDIIGHLTDKREWAELPVEQVMSTPVVHVSATTQSRAGYELMTEQGIRHLVIDPDESGGFRVLGEQAFAALDRRASERRADRVDAVMQFEFPKLPPDAPVRKAIELLGRDKLDFVLVTHNRRPLGMLTERDLLRNCNRLVDDLDTPVDRLMTSPVVTVAPDASLDAALDNMEAHQVMRLVVVDSASRIQGIVSMHQLIDAQHRRFIAKLQNNLKAAIEQQFPGQLLDVIGDGVAVIERGSGQLIETNARLAGWLGYTTADMIGKPLHEIVADDLPPALWGIDENLLPIGPVFRSQLLRHDGRPMSVEVSVKRVTFDEQPLVVAVIRDLTERDAAEKALGESEGRLRQIFETNQAVKLILDPDDGTIVDANGAACRFYGYEREQLIGMSISRINQLNSTRLAPILTQARRQQRKSFRLRHTLASGDVREVEVFSGPLHVDDRTLLYSIVYDITERVQAEAALSASEERLELALRGADLGLWDWDIPSGAVTFSERWASMLGESAQDIQGHVDSWWARIHPDDVQRVTTALQEHLDGNTKQYEISYRMRHSLGGWRWILDRGQVVERGADGQPLRAAGTHMDVTDAHKAQERLRLVAKVFENSSEGVIITDAEGRIVEVNAAFSQITGYQAEEAIDRTPQMLNSGRHDKAFYQTLWHQLHETGGWRGEIWNRRKDGEIYPEWLSISAIHDDAGQTQNFVAVFSDISEQHRSREELEFLAHHDALTSLPNRLLFNARLDHAIAHARRTRHQLAVIFIDVDRFKAINDSLGHATGDDVLRRAADRMRQAIRADDTMARLGGDEFIILLEDITPLGVREVADKLADSLTEPFIVNDEPIYLSLSTGIAMYPQDGDDVDTLVKNADAAMYKAKDSGRDNFQFYTPSLTDEAREQVFLQNHLRRAIELEEFRVFYQPQVDVDSGRATGVEALLRWEHPTEGLIMPGRFIPLLEEHGLMRHVGPWVLRRACEDYVRWQAAGIAPHSLAVNLSGAQIHCRRAVDGIEQILRETGMPADRLELEVTETFVMGDPESNINTLHRLRALGIRLAIDDFGTGYSSLTYLKRLPINKLKIDRSFVKDVPGDADDEAITRAVIGLGRTLNLDIIAEGVERQACADFLVQEGCYHGQGYLWGKPMPEDEIVAWLKEFV